MPNNDFLLVAAAASDIAGQAETFQAPATGAVLRIAQTLICSPQRWEAVGDIACSKIRR